MIIFIVHVPYLAVLDLKRQTPVARNVQAPDSFAIPGELVGPLQWESAKPFSILHVLQERQHCPELIHGVRRQAFRIVIQVEDLKPLWKNVRISTLSTL